MNTTMGVAVRRMRVSLLAAVLMAMVAGVAPALAVPAQNTPPTLPPKSGFDGLLPPGVSLPPGVTLPPEVSTPAATSPSSSTSSTSSTSTTTPGTTSTSTTLANSTSSTTSSTVAAGPPAPSIAAGATTGGGFPRSQNIALVPDASGQENHGGSFPTSGFPGGYAPVFTNVSAEAIRDNATDPIAAGYDTVVLNSLCGIAGFLSNGQFKSRIEGFASRGGKLLIWDSECTSTDYSNFAIPFTTSNPGAAGAQGTLTDTEDNTLSSSNTASASYVNLNAVATDTDAVGDANVFTTFDSRWFLDLKATNRLGVNGAAQAYANLGSGIVIYNGLDKDDIGGGGFDPASTSGSVHLNRIWMLDLLQAWNPDGLPHANPVVGGGNFGVSPSEGPIGTAFTFKYSCPAGSYPVMLILDDTGRPLAQGFGYGLPVSGNGRDYVQAITMKVAGTFTGSLRCSGVPSGSSGKFVVSGRDIIGDGHTSPSRSKSWSGYAATGDHFTGVVTKFTMPSVDCTSLAGIGSGDLSGVGEVAFWAGIDGFLDKHLVQAGTVAFCSGANAPADYYAWWEVLPNHQTRIDSAILPVGPGDNVAVEIQKDNNITASFIIRMTITTPSGVVHSFGPIVVSSPGSPAVSAECIVEASQFRGKPLPLPYFNVVHFTACLATERTSSADPERSAELSTGNKSGFRVFLINMTNGRRNKATTSPPAIPNADWYVTWRNAN